MQKHVSFAEKGGRGEIVVLWSTKQE